MFRTLLIEDNKHDFQLAKRVLEKYFSDIEITWVTTKKALDQIPVPYQFDLIMMDMKLPDANGLDILAEIQTDEIDIPVVFVTGSSNIRTAIEAMHIGATDFVVKDGDGEYLKILPEILEKAHRTWRTLKAAEKTEQERSKNEARYRALFEKSNDAVFLMDLEASLFAVNEKAADLFGYTVEELVSLSSDDVVVPDELAESHERLKDLLDGKQLPIYERKHLKKDGTIFPTEINVTLVYDGQGNPVHIQSIVRDITDRKNYEQVLIKQTEIFENLVEIARITTASPDLMDTISNVVKIAKTITNADHGNLFLLNEKGVVTHSFLENKIEKKNLVSQVMKKGLAGWVAQNRIPALIPNIEEDKRWHNFQNNLEKMKSALIIPILLHGKLTAILNLAHKDINHFTEDHQNILISASNQIALAVLNAKIFDDQRQFSERQTTLFETLRHLGETVDPISLAQMTIDTIKKFTNWTHVSLAFIDKKNGSEENEFRIAGWQGEEETALHNINKGIIGQSYQTNSIQVVNDVQKDPNYIEMRKSTKSEIAVPLQRNGAVFGILDIQSDQIGAFEDQDKYLVESLGDAISLAFTNAFLFEEQTQISSRQKTLYETLQIIGEEHQIETLTETAVNTISKQTNWPRIGILILENTPSWPKKKIFAFYQEMESEQVSALNSGIGVTGRAINTMLPQLVPDVTLDPDYVTGNPGTKSELIIPFKSGKNIVGILDIASEQPNAFSNEDVLLAESLTEALSLAIQNAALFEEIQQTAERLKEIDKLKSTFLASMSHEIRTPLNAIIGMSNLIETANLSPDNLESLQTIRSSSHLLLNLINEILDLSKIEANKLELENSSFNLIETIESSINIIKSDSDKKELTLSLNLGANIPKFVIGDQVRLQQILVNLLNNAVKFTNKGEVRLKVKKEISKKDRTGILFSIIDTGIGIRKNEIERIFDPFSQVENSSTNNYAGSGLGLPISKSLSNLMGGDLWVESKVGKGSAFSFNIFVSTPSTGELSGENDPLTGETIKSPENLAEHYFEKFANLGKTHPLRILIAEDNVVNQKVAIRTLGRLGYSVQVAQNGLEVLDCLKSNEIDLIFMDIQMPKMDGWEATKKIRATSIHKPYIVALTAHAMKEDRDKSLAVGMNAYIQKPYDVSKLIEVLQECQPANS